MRIQLPKEVVDNSFPDKGRPASYRQALAYLNDQQAALGLTAETPVYACEAVTRDQHWAETPAWTETLGDLLGVLRQQVEECVPNEFLGVCLKDGRLMLAHNVVCWRQEGRPAVLLWVRRPPRWMVRM